MRPMTFLMILSSALLFLQGCSRVRKTVAPLPPKELFINANDSDPRLPADFKRQYEMAEEKPFVNGEPVAGSKAGLRNQYIRILMAKVDTEYFKFTNDLYVGRSSIGFTGDLASLGLTAASTIVGDKDLKTILSGTATAVTGSSASFDKRFFQDQAIGALLTTMNASRLAVEATITANLKKPSSEYTLDDAILDVLQYHRAGTLLHAIAEIQTDQGNKAASSQATINTLKGTPNPPDSIPSRPGPLN